MSRGQAGAALDPRAIEREIARIREKESSPFAAGTKTNLFTLLILRSRPVGGHGDVVEDALPHLLGRRPARIVTIERVPGSPTQAWVSGRCFPDRHNRGVCFEEVRIEAGDDGLGADPGAWAPLLIRDLPVIAWLPDGRPDGREAGAAEPWAATLAAAAGLVDKVIVDTARAPAGAPWDSAAAAAWIGGLASGGPVVADLAWRRGRVLREQTARAFDPPEARPLIGHITGARLWGGSAAEAWLFARWLSARLGRPVGFAHAWEGPLAEGFRVTVEVAGAPAVEVGCTKGGCLSRGEETAGWRAATDGELLLEEVDSVARDPVYLQATGPAGAGHAS